MADRCDVAVVGGGLTGLLAADRLARAGADVLLIDSPQPPAAASTRSAGLVALGWIDSPARLVAALGAPPARSLVAWSAAAAVLVAALVWYVNRPEPVVPETTRGLPTSSRCLRLRILPDGLRSQMSMSSPI